MNMPVSNIETARDMIDNYLNLAEASQKKLRWRRAALYFEKAYLELKHLKTTSLTYALKNRCLEGLILVHHAQNKTEEACRYHALKKALIPPEMFETLTELNKHVSEAETLLTKQPEKTGSLMKTALETLETYPSNHPKVRKLKTKSYHILTCLALNQQNMKKAAHYRQKAKELIKTQKKTTPQKQNKRKNTTINLLES